MKRRQVLIAASSAAALALTVTRASAGGLEHVEYSREAFERAMDSGEPLLLDFYAGW